MWLHMIEVCFLFICLFVCDRGYKFKLLEWVCCVCGRARILLDVPRFCEELSQPGGRERRPACPKKGIGPPSLGQGLCRHNLCRSRAGCIVFGAVIHFFATCGNICCADIVRAWSETLGDVFICFLVHENLGIDTRIAILHRL